MLTHLPTSPVDDGGWFGGASPEGGSVQSVISELLIQQADLATNDPSGVPPLYRLLVEEYLAKAIAERGTTVATPVSQLPKAAPPKTVATEGGYGSTAHPLITLAVPGGQAVSGQAAPVAAPTTTTTTTASLGTALLVGGIIAVAGFLGYSAYIKQSPIDVIKSL